MSFISRSCLALSDYYRSHRTFRNGCTDPTAIATPGQVQGSEGVLNSESFTARLRAVYSNDPKGQQQWLFVSQTRVCKGQDIKLSAMGRGDNLLEGERDGPGHLKAGPDQEPRKVSE